MKKKGSPRARGEAAELVESKNGHRNGRANGKVRVAVVGVGNCASSFVQGVHYYRNASPKELVPGLMHVDLGGYHIRDIEFVAAFDIDKKKVGLDLSQAIFAGANNTVKFSDVPKLGVRVERGMTHDGIGKYLADVIEKAPGSTSDVVGILKKTKADVLVSYLPVGSEEATKWYVEQALQAGEVVVGERRDGLTVDADFTGRGAVESSDQIQQGGFAGPGRPDDGHHQIGRAHV